MTTSNHVELYNEDCLERLKKLDSNSIDSLVTDPPAGINLLSLEWDDDRGGRKEWVTWLTEIMTECYRVLKPGAHGFVWALPRTSHWTGCALEDAGFNVKDVITHVFGTGFPKNMKMDQLINNAKHLNTEDLYRFTQWVRERRDELGLTNADLDRVAAIKGGACHWTARSSSGQPSIPTLERWIKLETLLGPPPESLKALIRPSGEKRSEMSERNHFSSSWVGWGTALKPANEHWILIQKPIEGHNLAANVVKYKTGGLNIDGCRIATTDKIAGHANLDFKTGALFSKETTRSKESLYEQHQLGRFPTNFILTEGLDHDCAIRTLDKMVPSQKTIKPSHFFYCIKPSKKEKGEENVHPTVKPIELMRYLCRMITPPGGVVLDPFMGSGTTGVAANEEKFNFLGIEREKTYFEIARKRLRIRTCNEPHL